MPLGHLSTHFAYSRLLVIQPEHHHATIRNAAGYPAGIAGGIADAIPKADEMIRLAAKVAEREPPHSGGVDVNGSTLRAPDMDRVRVAAGPGAADLTPAAMFTLVAGRLTALLEESGLQSMKQRLHSFQANMAIRTAQNEKFSAALEAALKAAEDAGAGADAARAEVGSQEGAVRAARDEVERLRAELEHLSPDDPDYPARQAELDAARHDLQAAEGGLEKAAAALLVAGAAFSTALDQVEQCQREIDRFNAGAVVLSPRPDQSARGAAETLQKLIAQLSIIGAEVSLNQLKNETEMLMAALKAREAENLERARKHEAEQQRARDAEKKTGCAGKILKWVSAAVSVVGMLMTIDSMVGESTGFSIMGKLTELVSSGISAALTTFGVSASLARQIADIAAVVVIAVAVIAMMVLAGNVGGALQVVMAAQNVTRAMDAARVAVEVLQAIGQLISTAASITVGVGQIIVAGIMIDIAKLLAAMEDSIFGSEILRDMLEKVRDSADALYRTSLDLIRQMGSVIQDNADTGKAIIAHTRSHA